MLFTTNNWNKISSYSRSGFELYWVEYAMRQLTRDWGINSLITIHRQAGHIISPLVNVWSLMWNLPFSIHLWTHAVWSFLQRICTKPSFPSSCRAVISSKTWQNNSTTSKKFRKSTNSRLRCPCVHYTLHLCPILSKALHSYAMTRRSKFWYTKRTIHHELEIFISKRMHRTVICYTRSSIIF